MKRTLPTVSLMVATLLLGGCANRLGGYANTQDDLSQAESKAAATALHSIATKTFILCDLGTLGGNTASPRSMNNRGQIVGVSSIANGSHRAFLWQDGRMVNLGDSLAIDDANDEHGGSMAVTISDNGIVTGSGLNPHALKRNGLRDAAHLVPKGFGPDAVSRNGVIVAREVPVAGGSTEDRKVCVIAADGTVRPVTFPANQVRAVVAVNDREEMVVFLNAQGDRFGFWDGHGLHELDPNAGDPVAVTRQGVVAGASSHRAATLWPMDHRLILPGLPGRPATGSRDMNNAGIVVGSAAPSSIAGYPDPDNSRAVQWKGRRAEDLNRFLPRNSGWVLTEATAINDHGWIVGEGVYKFNRRAFLLRPEASQP